MAQIKMDVSEYEAMKENKKLLEQSLKKERELQLQIQDLTKEKLQALEDAKMKVVKVKKIERRDYVIQKRIDESRIIRDLLITLGIYPDRMGRSIDTLRYSLDIEKLRNIFFEYGQTHSYPEVEETTLHGLDEVVAEIREDLKNSMDKETNDKLKLAEETLEKNERLVKGNSSLMKENRKLEEKCNKFSKVVDDLTIENKERDDKVRRFEEVKAVLEKGYNFFGKGKILDHLIQITFEKKEI